jgi:hypothetical protein
MSRTAIRATASSTRTRILSGAPSGAEEGVNLLIRQAVLAHTAQVLANRDEPIDPSEHGLYEWEFCHRQHRDRSRPSRCESGAAARK